MLAVRLARLIERELHMPLAGRGRTRALEFSFAPNDVTEKALRSLLAFMIEIGEAMRKPVIMTPENCPHEPIFRCQPDEHQLSWNPPNIRSSAEDDERR